MHPTASQYKILVTGSKLSSRNERNSRTRALLDTLPRPEGGISSFLDQSDGESDLDISRSSRINHNALRNASASMVVGVARQSASMINNSIAPPRNPTFGVRGSSTRTGVSGRRAMNSGVQFPPRGTAFGTDPCVPPVTGVNTDDAGLTGAQMEILKSTIADYCSNDLRKIVMTDIKEQLKQLDKSGYSHPPETNNGGVTSSEEFQLYQAQLQRNKEKHKRRLASLLRFVSLGLAWFCEAMRFEVVQTKHLPAIVKAAITAGEYDDILGSCGEYVDGTVLENPLFACALKFVENIGSAHQKSVSKQLADLEKQRNRQEQFVSINKLQALRSRSSQPNGPISLASGPFDAILKDTGATTSSVSVGGVETKSPRRSQSVMPTASPSSPSAAPGVSERLPQTRTISPDSSALSTQGMDAGEQAAQSDTGGKRNNTETPETTPNTESPMRSFRKINPAMATGNLSKLTSLAHNLLATS